MGYHQLCSDSIQRSIKGLIRSTQESRHFLRILVRGQNEVRTKISQNNADVQHLREIGLKYGVRATSLVCLLGVGIGLGSFFLYRLWNKVFPRPPQHPFNRKRRSRPNTPTSLSDDGNVCVGSCNKEQVLPDSPDSGCLTMGNTDSNLNSTAATPDSPTAREVGVLTTSEPDQTNLKYRGKRSRSVDHADGITEGEYGSFVVLDNRSNTTSDDVTSNWKSQSADLINKNLIDLDLSENQNINSSHSFVEISMRKDVEGGKEHLNHPKSSQNNDGSYDNIVKPTDYLESSGISNRLTGGMQGSMISSASTDLGFVSGNYTSDHGRESSLEPPSFDLDSLTPSLPFDLKSKTHAKLLDSSSLNQHQKDLMSFKEIRADLPINYTMSPLDSDRSKFSDGFVSYSFLNDTHENSSLRYNQHTMRTPHTRALSDGGGNCTSFNIGQATHSTPQCDSDDELFKAMKRTPRAPKKHSQSHYYGMRRNCSFTSEMSTTSDGSYYLFGGHSVDLGENLSGRSTPDSEAFRGIAIGGKTESNICQIQSQIQLLRNEIDEMTDHIQKLSSRDNLSYLPEIDGVEEVHGHSRLPKTSKVFHKYSRTSVDGSSVSSLNLSEDQSESKLMTPNQGDFMWDYQSDLATGEHQNFVARRPIVGNVDAAIARCESPMALQHIKKYLHEQSQSVSLSNETRNMTNPGDIYIDDGLSFNLQQRGESPDCNNKTRDSVGYTSATTQRPTSLHKGYPNTREKKETSSSQSKLCSDCQNDCCTKCGKQINMNNNNNNSKCEAATNTNITTIDTVSKSNYTQTDSLYVRSNGELSSGGGLSSTPISSASCCIVRNNHSKCNNCSLSNNDNNGIRVPPIGRAASNSPTPVAKSDNIGMNNSGFVTNPAFTSTPTHNTTTAVYSCNNTPPHHNCLAENHVHKSHANCNHQPHVCGSNMKFCIFSAASSQCQQENMGNCSQCLGLCNKSSNAIIERDCCSNSTPKLTHQQHCKSNETVENFVSSSNCSVHQNNDQLKTAASYNQQNHHALVHSYSPVCGHDDHQPSCMQQLNNSFTEQTSCNQKSNSPLLSRKSCSAASRSKCIRPSSAKQVSSVTSNAKCQQNDILESACQQHETCSEPINHPMDITPENEHQQLLEVCDRDKVSMKSKVEVSQMNWEVMNIGERFQISDYVEKEWKGNTEKADTIRKGYEKIPSLLNLSHIRQVRGDNYCALRATLYQILVNCLPIHNHMGSLQNTLQKLEIFQSDNYKFLQKWNFANRLPYDKTQVYETIKQCVKCLYQEIQTCWNQEDKASREEYFIRLLNSNPDIDLQLMEAVKCLMMVNAIQYYEENQAGNDVPVFVWLLFARDTSDTPEQFMLNHMNKIGDAGGLEQVEMFLLGYSLGVKISVVRPYLCGKDDFITHFPDEGADSYPRVHLIAEDDRHYNVLVS